MFKFNSRKLISLCRRMVKTIEDNDIAEELLLKLSRVEIKYQSAYDSTNKYMVLVKETVRIFNETASELEKISIINNENFHMLPGVKEFKVRICNRYNAIEKSDHFFIGHPPIETTEGVWRYFFEHFVTNGMEPLFGDPSLKDKKAFYWRDPNLSYLNQ